MRYLLDTHILLWALTGDAKLPERAKDVLYNPDNKIYYSIISIWEAAIKRLKHPDKITKLAPDELIYFCTDADFHCLTLRPKHIYTLETLSRPDDAPPHKDPFDRILISQAKSENMLFLTHDDSLTSYSEPCIIYA